MREMGQDLGDGEAVGCRLPPSVLVGQLGHQAAQDAGGRFEQVEARQSVVGHDVIL
jgi:hypothetical protein